MTNTRKTTDEILNYFIERVREEHKPHVRSMLSDLIFYVEGSLSYHHAPPFVRALLTNKLNYIAQRAGEVDLLYLGIYGEFMYEYVPPDKLMGNS
jgi:hypothetical protein